MGREIEVPACPRGHGSRKIVFGGFHVCAGRPRQPAADLHTVCDPHVAGHPAPSLRWPGHAISAAGALHFSGLGNDGLSCQDDIAVLLLLLAGELRVRQFLTGLRPLAVA